MTAIARGWNSGTPILVDYTRECDIDILSNSSFQEALRAYNNSTDQLRVDIHICRLLHDCLAGLCACSSCNNHTQSHTN